MDDRDQENIENSAATAETASVGAQLRAAREAAGLSLTEIANRTRVPVRHLEAIEASNYSALPGSTYTIGFTKSFAKSLGLNETAILTEMREELAQGGYHGNAARMPAYEPTDPARVPSRPLAWGAAALAIALIVIYFIWRSYALSPVAEDEAAKPVAEAAIKDPTGKPKAAEPIDPAGPVVISAKETVWLKIYDAENKRLYENEMKAGESYTVPADANNPMIVTGRPQVLDITIGGKPVPPLGTGERSVADVGVSAAALLARKPQTPAPVQPGSASPNAAAASPSQR
ncbi:MAG: helix-turn-helix domain-containing protein [Sphingorhabdus sp.]